MFVFYNDTGREVKIHPATHYDCEVDRTPIKPLEQRVFRLPEGFHPWVKMWDYGDIGLSILVSAIKEN